MMFIERVSKWIECFVFEKLKYIAVHVFTRAVSTINLSKLCIVLAMKAAEHRVRNKEKKFGEKAIPKPLKTTRWTKTGLEATANIIGRWWVCLTNYRTLNVFPTIHWLFSNRDVCLWNMKGVEAWILCLFFLPSHLFLREKRLLFEFETRLAFLARFIIFLVHN